MEKPAVRSLTGLVCALALVVGSYGGSARALVGDPGPTQKATCGSGDHPEPGLQGRRTAGELADTIKCNTSIVSRFGDVSSGTAGAAGGYRVYRYVDHATPTPHECGFYDSTLLFPLNGSESTGQGVVVLDMHDPANPTRTANLRTPAMLSPHESLSINEARGLLAADMGYPTFNPGFVDLYDIWSDCLHPSLLSSTPLGILGHEGTFSPDGNTFWVSSTGGHTLTAVDVTEPRVPRVLWTTAQYAIHGMNVSNDGTRLYAADTSAGLSGGRLTIFDISHVRDVPPSVTEVGHVGWPEASIPQTAIPVTIGSYPYLVEVDEFEGNLDAGNPDAPIGAARIIDIADDTQPVVISNIRLEVNMPENVAADAGDPGASFFLQGYTGHYCAVPQRAEPGIVACSFILSGLRVFDIRDALHPKEIAYFNGPVPSSSFSFNGQGGSYAMSAPAFDPGRGNIWYTDGSSGFYALHVRDGVWPF